MMSITELTLYLLFTVALWLLSGGGQSLRVGGFMAMASELAGEEGSEYQACAENYCLSHNYRCHRKRLVSISNKFDVAANWTSPSTMRARWTSPWTWTCCRSWKWTTSSSPCPSACTSASDGQNPGEPRFAERASPIFKTNNVLPSALVSN